MAYHMDKLKILLIEKNWHMRSLTKSILQAFGVNSIHSIADPITGYEMLKKTEYDIVIVDWMVEPMNGLDFTKKVRTDPDSPCPYVPIILMTGYSERSRVIAARDSGITEFLAKPFTSRSMYGRIEHIIEKPRQFIISKKYCGPDRRRINNPDFKGVERRRNQQYTPKSVEKVYL